MQQHLQSFPEEILRFLDDDADIIVRGTISLFDIYQYDYEEVFMKIKSLLKLWKKSSK